MDVEDGETTFGPRSMDIMDSARVDDMVGVGHEILEHFFIDDYAGAASVAVVGVWVSKVSVGMHDRMEDGVGTVPVIVCLLEESDIGSIGNIDGAFDFTVGGWRRA